MLETPHRTLPSTGANLCPTTEVREARCKGTFSPYKYTVRVDDSHDQWRYRMATTALSGQSVDVPSFFMLCAEYVIQHHRGLKEVRPAIQERERS